MRNIGLLLFIVGTVVASAYASRAVQPKGTGEAGAVTASDRLSDWGSKAGAPFGIGLVLMVAGGVVARRRPSSEEADSEGTGGRADPKAVVRKILETLDAMELPSSAENSAKNHERLDEILEEQVPSFLESRQALIDKMGLGSFALMIGHFASLERNVARSWSAITDEAYAEVDPCIQRAKSAGQKALEALG